MKPISHHSKLKAAELLSLLGAGVLGAGVGLLLAGPLGAYGLPILLLGGTSHLIGMWRKHQIEKNGASQQPAWYGVLYWLCWALLLAVLIAVAAYFLSSLGSA